MNVDYLRESPARAMKKTKEAPGCVRYLTVEELELLLSGHNETVKASDGRTWTSARPIPPCARASSWRSRAAAGAANSSTFDGATLTCGPTP